METRFIRTVCGAILGLMRLNYLSFGGSGAADDVGHLRRRRQVLHCNGWQTFQRQAFGQRGRRCGVAAPDSHLLQPRPQGEVGACHPRCQPTRTHQQQAARVRPRKVPGGQRRDNRSAAQRHGFPVHAGQRRAGAAVQHQQRCLNGVCRAVAPAHRHGSCVQALRPAHSRAGGREHRRLNRLASCKAV